MPKRSITSGVEVREGYGLTWPGKAAALLLAEAPTVCTLRARPDLDVGPGVASHAIIEGENLDVLKLLLAARGAA